MRRNRDGGRHISDGGRNGSGEEGGRAAAAEMETEEGAAAAAETEGERTGGWEKIREKGGAGLRT
jgi:hypothetical protein